MLSYGLLDMNTPVLADQQKLPFISSVDTGCHLDDLSRAIIDKNERESKESMLTCHDNYEVCDFLHQVL